MGVRREYDGKMTGADVFVASIVDFCDKIMTYGRLLEYPLG